MVFFFFDPFQQFVGFLLFLCRFFDLCPVFVHVHVFIRQPEQFPEGGTGKVQGDCVPCRIADRHLRVFFGVVFHLCADLF